MSISGGARLRGLLVVGACVLTLRSTSATPARALGDARAAVLAGSAADPFAALVPAVALLAWALVTWLAATVLLTVVGELPGTAGRCAAAAARRIAPAAVRRAVQLALGLGLAAGVASAGPASAAPLTEGSGASAAAVSAPLTEGPGTSAAAVSTPSLDWPTAARPGPAVAPAAAPASATAPAAAPAASRAVVVAPGDSLWSLAERSLGPGATAQQVAATWPAWWAANRDVVGANPHLIHPGDRLTPPPAPS